jgi:hypothetical protein
MSNPISRTLGQLDIPKALPVAEFDLVNQRVSKYAETDKAIWHAFASAWNAVVFRWRAAHEHGSEFIRSVTKSSSPEINERFRQDHNLFVFATSAVSAIECFYFASYCFASLVDSASFPMSKQSDLRFSRNDVVVGFQKIYSTDSITFLMASSLESSEFHELIDLRNVLAHRGTPPRLHFGSNCHKDAPSAIPRNLKELAPNWQYDFALEPSCLDAYLTIQIIIMNFVLLRRV